MIFFILMKNDPQLGHIMAHNDHSALPIQALKTAADTPSVPQCAPVVSLFEVKTHREQERERATARRILSLLDA